MKTKRANLALPNSSRITNGYDTGARLIGTWLRNSSGTILNKHVYQYNTGGLRSKQTRQDNSYVNYGYDNNAQLGSALGYTSGGSPIANEQLTYTYDAGWNLIQRTANGSPTTYTVNDRNQATYENTPFWHGYNANGNRISRMDDGSQTVHYAYDDENRLVLAHFMNSSWTSGWKSEFTYDGLSRLRRSVESYWTSTGGTNGYWTVNGDTRRVYDGMRVVQERNASNVPTVAYTRGLDLSGSLEGAGGIGGLLTRSHGYSGGTWSTHSFYHADGGGNITMLINSSQTSVAVYRYDPYGRTLSQTGSLAWANLYRFSSKEIHAQSGLYYYGYRFYDPNLQRWINRDPIGELGGINLYTFVDGNPIYFIDPYGLYSWQEWLEIVGAGLGGASEGAAATADGFLPFWDPFESFYDECDPLFIRSQNLGGLGFNALTMAGGGAALNAFGKALASAGGVNWSALNAVEKLVVSRGSIPIAIANSAELV